MMVKAGLLALVLQAGVGFTQEASLRRSVAPTIAGRAIAQPIEHVQISFGYALAHQGDGFAGLSLSGQHHRLEARLAASWQLAGLELHVGAGPSLIHTRVSIEDDSRSVGASRSELGLTYGAGMKVPWQPVALHIEVYGLRRGERDDVILLVGAGWTML